MTQELARAQAVLELLNLAGASLARSSETGAKAPASAESPSLSDIRNP